MIEKMSDKTKKYLVYGMVAFVTILFISSYIVGKKEEKKQEVQQEVDAKIKAEKYKKEQYENNYQTEEEIIQQKKETVTEAPSKFNYEESYIEKYGKSSVSQAKDISKKTVKKWLSGSTDWDKENDIMTLELIESLKLESAVDDGIERVIKIGAARPVSTTRNNEIKIEVEVSWQVKAGKKLEGGRSAVAYVSVVKDNGQWKAKELIVT